MKYIERRRDARRLCRYRVIWRDYLELGVAYLKLNMGLVRRTADIARVWFVRAAVPMQLDRLCGDVSLVSNSTQYG